MSPLFEAFRVPDFRLFSSLRARPQISYEPASMGRKTSARDALVLLDSGWCRNVSVQPWSLSRGQASKVPAADGTTFHLVTARTRPVCLE